MHQQVILRVRFETNFVYDSSRHRNRTYPSRTDEWVNWARGQWFISFAISTPLAVPMAKANMPIQEPRVCMVKKISAVALSQPQSEHYGNDIISAFRVVSANLSTTPHSREIAETNIPNKGAAEGNKNATSSSSKSGNDLFS